jgi:NitT/TauT family transport system substrate-binding protein
MSLSRRTFLAVTAAALPGPAFAQNAIPPIRFGGTTNDTAAEPYYAQELGYFKRAGLNVEITTLGNGAAIAQAIAGGALDVGGTNLVGLGTAIAHNIPFALVAGGGVYSTDAPTTVLCVAKNAPYKTAKDLNGKTVSVPSLKDLTYAAAAGWLEQNGADVASIKFIEISFPEASAALDRGTIAAGMIAEPSLSAGLRSTVRIFGKAFDAVAKQFMITATFATNDWIRKNADAAHKLAQAIYETGRWANVRSNQARSGEILAGFAKLDPAVIASMTRATYATSADPKLLQPPLDIAYKYKFIDRQMSASELLPR